MKRLLSNGVLWTLGLAGMLTSVTARGQELNFRAVVSRPAPTISAPAVETGTIVPVSLSRPTPVGGADFEPVFRAKVGDDTPLLGQEPIPKLEIPRPMPSKGVPMLSPPPTGVAGPTSPFVPPPPGAVNSGTVVMPPGHVVQSPTHMAETVMAPGSVVVSDGTTSCNTCGGGFGGCNLGSCGGDSGCGSGCGNSCGNSCGLGCGWCPLSWLSSCPYQCNLECCPQRSRFWVRGEYLLWDMSRQHIPPLVTLANSGRQADLPIGRGGVVFGNDTVSSSASSGGRFGLGFWFPRCCDWGMDVSYFFLGQQSQSYNLSSGGVPAIGRPYVEMDPRAPTFMREVAENVATLETGPGAINIDYSTKIWGLDANLRRKWCCGPNHWIDVVFGFRHFQLEDNINITEDLYPTQVAGAPFPVQRIIVQDQFGTRNVFNGGQVGFESEWRFRPRLTLGTTFKIALGSVNQTIDINGSTTRTVQGAGNQMQIGGLLAQRSNIGEYSTYRFAVLPEFGIKLGFDLTQHLRVYAGYNVMYLSNVVRAGDQIDRRVNTSQFAFTGPGAHPNQAPGVLTGQATPAVLFRTTDFWAQGVNFGLEWHY